jgi:hypothetical protein
MLPSLQLEPVFLRRLILKCSCCAAGSAVLLAIAPPAHSIAILGADSLTFLFKDTRFNNSNANNDPSLTLGENPNTGTNSWLEAVIKNTNTTNSIILTLDANLTKASVAFISSVAFNLVDGSTISSVCAGTIPASNCVNQDFTYDSDNINMANGIQGLDFRLNLPLAGGPNSDRLDHYDTFSFIITGSNLNFSSFNEPIDIDGEGIFAAARLQGYGGSSTIYSAPGPLPILGVAAAFRTSRRLRRRLTSARLASGRPPAHRPA